MRLRLAENIGLEEGNNLYLTDDCVQADLESVSCQAISFQGHFKSTDFAAEARRSNSRLDKKNLFLLFYLTFIDTSV